MAGRRTAWSIKYRVCWPVTIGDRKCPSGLLGDVMSSITGRSAVLCGGLTLESHAKAAVRNSSGGMVSASTPREPVTAVGKRRWYLVWGCEGVGNVWATYTPHSMAVATTPPLERPVCRSSLAARAHTWPLRSVRLIQCRRRSLGQRALRSQPCRAALGWPPRDAWRCRARSRFGTTQGWTCVLLGAAPNNPQRCRAFPIPHQ